MRAALIVMLLTRSAIAQPGTAAPAAPSGVTEPSPSVFAELAGTLGETHEGEIYAGVMAAGGYRVRNWFWLHAAVAAATAPVVGYAGIDQYQGQSLRFAELRGGGELRTCTTTGGLCAIAGVDIGYRSERFVDNGDVTNRSSPEAVGRLGADIGGRAFRMRAAVEGTSTKTGDTGAFVLGVAFRM